MKYKIWNKKDIIIEGVSAEYIIGEMGIRESDGVFYIIGEHDKVEYIEIDRIIKSVYKLDPNLTTEQVAEEYIKIKEKNESNENESIKPNEPNEIEKLNEKIDGLETKQASIEYTLMMGGLI